MASAPVRLFSSFLRSGSGLFQGRFQTISISPLSIFVACVEPMVDSVIDWFAARSINPECGTLAKGEGK
jgi:hypothetical protein